MEGGCGCGGERERKKDEKDLSRSGGEVVELAREKKEVP
jgi:hypothetical protein